MQMRKLMVTGMCAASVLLAGANARAALVADVAFVLDQSGSMRSEYDWLASSISAIDSKMSDAGITSRYALAGYEEYVGNEASADPDSTFLDFTSDISNIVTAVNNTNLYGGHERGYYAADAARSLFSWNNDAAKVIVLVTDEAADQSSGISEAQLGANMSDGGFLLNVIAPSNRYGEWDDAAYSKGDYTGVFDLAYLNNDPEGFTEDFTEAKIQEIKDVVVVPEPGSLALLGTGLLGLASMRRRKA